MGERTEFWSIQNLTQPWCANARQALSVRQAHRRVGESLYPPKSFGIRGK